MDTDRRDLEVLLEFSRVANTAATVDAVLYEIARAVRNGLGYDRVGIFLTDPANCTRMIGAVGTNPNGVDEPISHLVFNAGDDPRWEMVHSGEREYLYTDDAARCLDFRLPGGKPIRHHVVIPLKTPQRLLGALAVDNAFTDRPIEHGQVQTLLALGRQAAVALQTVLLIDEFRQSEERLRSLVTSLTETLYSVRIHGGTVSPSFYSPQIEELTGYTAEEALSTPDFWRTVTYQEDRLKVDRAKDELAKGRGLSLEYRIVHKSGEVKWVLDTPVAVDNQDESVLVNGSILDITDRKHLEDRLRRAQRMETVGTLAGGVAHNFNNYLQMVMLLIDNARLDLEDNHPVSPFLNRAQETLHNAASLAKQLVAFGEKGEGARAELLLDDLIARSLSLIEPSLGKSIRVEHLLDSDVAPVVVDAAQIQQVLINLCINARDAMEGPGSITIRTQNVLVREQDRRKPPGFPAGDYVRLQVHDTGTGMDEATQQRIFEPFFTTKPPGRGTGLGLAVTYTIVTDHGGWIDVESQPGRGTLFSIYLPSASTARYAPVPLMAEPPERTVLIVDPVEHERESLAGLLESLGVDVMTAEGVSDAMAVLWDAGDRLDAVFCSLTLGSVDLAQLAQEMRGNGSAPRLIVTGDKQGASKREIEGVPAGLAVINRPYAAAKVAEAMGMPIPNERPVKHRERGRRTAANRLSTAASEKRGEMPPARPRG